MKDFVLVEFIASYPDDSQLLQDKLAALGDDFQHIAKFFERESDFSADHLRISGRISSEYATVIKLQDAFLAERMRISYIPEELKNKYRK